MKKEFPVLYKYTTKGQVQQWQIIAENNTFYTIEGIKDGKLTTSIPTVCKGKNIGKKNETSDEEQAIAEAAAKHQKKLDKGYNEILSSEKAYFEPMLAEECIIDKLDFDKEEYYAQPKLDGLRSVGETGKHSTRNGKPLVSCPHLLHFEENIILDGEFYNHDLKEDFNKIMSLCKKQKPTDEELAESAQMVQYWIYDLPSHDGVFIERYEKLKSYINSCKNSNFVLVETVKVESKEHLKEIHADNISRGYEGTIVRLNKPYENKRTKSLLKYKEFTDEEFKILDVIEGEGNRTGTAGKFVLKNHREGKPTFESNIKGNFAYLRDILQNKKDYIGKSATVKYFNLTPLTENGMGNVPRFPYVIKIAREDYE